MKRPKVIVRVKDLKTINLLAMAILEKNKINDNNDFLILNLYRDE